MFHCPLPAVRSAKSLRSNLHYPKLQPLKRLLNLAWVEGSKSAPIVLAFGQDRRPGKTCLSPFQDQHLEQGAAKGLVRQRGRRTGTGESPRSPDSMAEREGIEPTVLVHLCFALAGQEVGGFSGGIYHQLSRDDVRIEFA